MLVREILVSRVWGFGWYEPPAKFASLLRVPLLLRFATQKGEE